MSTHRRVSAPAFVRRAAAMAAGTSLRGLCCSFYQHSSSWLTTAAVLLTKGAGKFLPAPTSLLAALLTFVPPSRAALICLCAVQHECIPQAILGMDVICQAKSGMGKTAVFVISTLQQLEPVDGEVSVVVLCHTRELAYQICHEYERFTTYMKVGWLL